MENIIENNKLIAEFMEFEKTKQGGLYISPEGFEWERFLDVENYILPNQFLFHSSWDWLMKVVEKIHSMQSYGVLINPNGTYIQDEDDKVICMTFKNEEVNGEIISSSNIEATFNCCAEFVKWYNEQNKK